MLDSNNTNSAHGHAWVPKPGQFPGGLEPRPVDLLEADIATPITAPSTISSKSYEKSREKKWVKHRETGRYVLVLEDATTSNSPARQKRKKGGKSGSSSSPTEYDSKDDEYIYDSDMSYEDGAPRPNKPLAPSGTAPVAPHKKKKQGLNGDSGSKSSSQQSSSKKNGQNNNKLRNGTSSSKGGGNGTSQTVSTASSSKTKDKKSKSSNSNNNNAKRSSQESKLSNSHHARMNMAGEIVADSPPSKKTHSKSSKDPSARFNQFDSARVVSPIMDDYDDDVEQQMKSQIRSKGKKSREPMVNTTIIVNEKNKYRKDQEQARGGPGGFKQHSSMQKDDSSDSDLSSAELSRRIKAFPMTQAIESAPAQTLSRQSSSFSAATSTSYGEDEEDSLGMEELISRQDPFVYTFKFTILTGVIALMIFGLIAFAQRNQEDPAPILPPTLAPTEYTTIDFSDEQFELLASRLLPTVNAFTFIASTPQYDAFRWLLNNDQEIYDLEKTPEAILIQRFALAALYFATEGSMSWLDDRDWLSEYSECIWSNVICKDGLVTSLNLQGNILSGFIPPEIGLLTGLTSIDLSSNKIAGTLSSEFGSLSNLKTIYLSGNSVEGSIPSEIGALTQLTYLQLSINDLTGSLPTDLGKLVNLEFLSLSQNTLSGDIPTELGLLVKLTSLQLGSNSLSSSLPTEFGALTMLELLYMNKNKLVGEIPSQLGQLSDLQNLLLANNLLTGKIPSNIGELSSMTSLDLHKNILENGIPSEIGQLSKLISLQLQENEFSGVVPTEMGRLTGLTGLSLGSNSFRVLPFHLSNLVNMVSFDASQNLLTGTFPFRERFFQEASSLQSIDLSVNSFEGEIPTLIGLAKKLTKISFRDNSFKGTIPKELSSLTRLSFLELDTNELTGVVPSELGELGLLDHVTLHGNQLTDGLANLFCSRQLSDFTSDCNDEITCGCCTECF